MQKVCNICQKTLNHELFKEWLLIKDQRKTETGYDPTKNQNRQIVVTYVHKVALSSFDDKRYLLNEGIHSLAYGH